MAPDGKELHIIESRPGESVVVVKDSEWAVSNWAHVDNGLYATWVKAGCPAEFAIVARPK